MGTNDRIAWDLLNDLEDMLFYEILDPERDIELIGTIEAIAHETPVTPEQRAEYDAHIGALMDDLEEERTLDALQQAISKDD